MRPRPIQKLHSEPAQQERGATSNSLEQTTAKAARAPERDTPSRQSEAPTSDISTAVERKNATGKPNHKSVERKHVVRERHRPRQSATPPPPADARPSGTPPDHSNKTDDCEAAMKAFGTTEPGFLKGLSEHLLDASARGDDKFDNGLVFSFAVLKGAKPKDELDAMHVTQMAAVHMAIIRLSGELARVEYVPHLESITRAINQLARTYTAQLEARERHRTAAEQTTVNVSVTEGGQAIVGNVTQAAHGVPPDGLTNSTPALTDARQPPMDIIGGSERVPVPLRKK